MQDCEHLGGEFGELMGNLLKLKNNRDNDAPIIQTNFGIEEVEQLEFYVNKLKEHLRNN